MPQAKAKGHENSSFHSLTFHFHNKTHIQIIAQENYVFHQGKPCPRLPCPAPFRSLERNQLLCLARLLPPSQRWQHTPAASEPVPCSPPRAYLLESSKTHLLGIVGLWRKGEGRKERRKPLELHRAACYLKAFNCLRKKSSLLPKGVQLPQKEEVNLRNPQPVSCFAEFEISFLCLSHAKLETTLATLTTC